MTPSDIARIGYAANAVYSATLGESNPEWEDADEVDRRMWIDMAQWHQGNPCVAYEDAQDRWLDHEKAAGWDYSPVLDNELKRHPNHVPWPLLNEPHRRKIRMFAAIVACMSLGYF